LQELRTDIFMKIADCLSSKNICRIIFLKYMPEIKKALTNQGFLSERLDSNVLYIFIKINQLQNQTFRNTPIRSPREICCRKELS